MEEGRGKNEKKNEEISSILLVNTEIPFPRANAAGTSFVVFTLIFDASSIRHGERRSISSSSSRSFLLFLLNRAAAFFSLFHEVSSLGNTKCREKRATKILCSRPHDVLMKLVPFCATILRPRLRLYSRTPMVISNRELCILSGTRLWVFTWFWYCFSGVNYVS